MTLNGLPTASSVGSNLGSIRGGHPVMGHPPLSAFRAERDQRGTLADAEWTS